MHHLHSLKKRPVGFSFKSSWAVLQLSKQQPQKTSFTKHLTCWAGGRKHNVVSDPPRRLPGTRLSLPLPTHHLPLPAQESLSHLWSYGLKPRIGSWLLCLAATSHLFPTAAGQGLTYGYFSSLPISPAVLHSSASAWLLMVHPAMPPLSTSAVSLAGQMTICPHPPNSSLAWVRLSGALLLVD